MTDIMTDRSPAAMVEAIEGNTVAFLLALGRAGGGEERDEPGIQWVIGGSPIAYHNCVVRADLAPEEADVAIAASLASFRAHGVPGSWHVGPSMRPPEIGARLVAHGFTPGDEPGMAADLHALNEAVSFPAALQIERVRDERTLDEWARTLSLGFGEGEREAFWVRDMYRRLGYGDAGAWRHYLGRIDGRGVATATSFLAVGVAGTYFVSTAPTFRRQGIGAAITLAALRDARDLGYRVAVLGASDMGHSVYRQLGFRDYCTLGVYEWQAAGP
jgi:GNAT superfamily N-acetyltransferase